MLNQRTLDAARKRKAAGHVWAASPTGFGARIMPTGSAAFVFNYRAGTGRAARKRTLTIGNAGNLTVEQAKAIALRHAAAVAAGLDPAAERDGARARRTAAKGETVALLVPAFIKSHHQARHHRRSDEVLRVLTVDAVRRWGPRPVRDITPSDVTRLIAEVIGRDAPVQARRLYIALIGFFRWSVQNHFLAVSPMASVAKPAAPRARDRLLSEAEIMLLWHACDAVHPAYAACVRFMVLTGCRRNEAARMKWTEVSLDDALWQLPASRSKNGRPHATYLSPPAIGLLRALPVCGEFAFTTRGSVALAGFSKVRSALQIAMEAKALELGWKSPPNDWTFHDLRRSLVSWLAGNGVAVHVADRLLNHIAGAFGGVVGVYQKYEFVEERRNALAAWGRHIETLATGLPSKGNIVSLRAA